MTATLATSTSGDQTSPLSLITPTGWQDYELLDSGRETKFERFGPYRLIRPESTALWPRALPEAQWQAADAVFAPDAEGEAGHWQFRGEVAPRWQMRYGDLRFWAQPTPFRHLGLFPEQASQWTWIAGLIRGAGRPVRVLSLFGYTGLATLAAASAGASVTHVDASKTTMAWARENQALSGLQDRPIRWLVDDAMKFVQREVRRGARYEGLILDPPKFGRGPKGEVWKIEEALPALLQICRTLLSERPLFVVLTGYATRLSSLSLRNLLQETLAGLGGQLEAGELGLLERSAGRIMPAAVFARWSSGRSVG
jgi:23S rRNA (cytosine1962-C5)-methyltransferase